MYRVFIAIWYKVNAFFGQKNCFLKPKCFFFLKVGRWTFMNIQKYFMKHKILCLKKHRTLGAWNRQFSSEGGGISCSYAFLGICEAWLPEAGFRSSKLKNEFISVKYILICGSTQKIRPLPLKMASQIPKNE